MKAYTRKQMGVIYRAVKEGKLSIDKADVSYLYDWADKDFQVFNTDDQRLFEKMHYGMKNAIEAVFAGNYESARVSIENMLAA